MRQSPSDGNATSAWYLPASDVSVATKVSDAPEPSSVIVIDWRQAGERLDAVLLDEDRRAPRAAGGRAVGQRLEPDRRPPASEGRSRHDTRDDERRDERE